ncbi:MAG: type II secretion system protein [Candidatus Omnitrophica bacterium]|nr:type II secretion system protein [Candidatus Omnitrophota bacterium]
MKNNAFTLIELMVVIIILSVILSIALPKFSIQVKKVQAQEAMRILYSLYAAQKDYFRETGAYSTDLNNLDVEVASIKHFSVPAVSNGSASSPCQPIGFIVSMVHQDNTFSLSLNANGALTCTVCGGGTVLCDQMGL